MIRFALLLLAAADLNAASSLVDIDSAAQLYQAAAVREQVRGSLAAMPKHLQQMFAADSSSKLSSQQLDAVTAAAQKGFRIDVFEPPALDALAKSLDPATLRKSLAFLGTDLGHRMVAADVALAQLDEPTVDKIMNGELSAPSTPQRDAVMAKLERAAQSTESTVQIYLSMGRALAIGTAIGADLDPVAAQQRAQKSIDTGRRSLEESMRAPLVRYMAYGYRDLSDADLKQLLAFLDSSTGKRYVAAYTTSLGAGFDAMGRRCGEQIGESWRELAQAESALPLISPAPQNPAQPPPVP